MENILTLTSLTMEQLITELDKELPSDAYSAVPGGADLTDIDPNYMRMILNSVFGMCGYGWGYFYDSKDLDLQHGIRKTASGEKDYCWATLNKMEFWFKLQVGEIVETYKIFASGASDNSVAGYALKGAITNAIGNAASNIGFQQSVYLGHRSHKTVGKEKTVSTMTGAKPATAAAAAPTRVPAAGPKPAPKPVPAATAKVPAPAVVGGTPAPDLEDLDAPSFPQDLVINLENKHKNKKVSELTIAALQFYGSSFQEATVKPELRDHAKAVITAAKLWLEYRNSSGVGA